MNEMLVCFLPVSEQSVRVSKSKMNTMWYKSQPREFLSKPQSPELVGFLIPVIGKALHEIVRLKRRCEASYFTRDRIIDYLNKPHQLVWETQPQGKTKSDC